MNRICTMMALMLALTPAAMRAQTVVGIETTSELKAALALSGDPAMRPVVQGYAPADWEAVADHMSRLPPPK